MCCWHDCGCIVDGVRNGVLVRLGCVISVWSQYDKIAISEMAPIPQASKKVPLTYYLAWPWK